MFHLRDALTGSGFSERASDVFAALGSGSVKQPDISYNKNKNTNFDDHQLERSIKQTDRHSTGPAAKDSTDNNTDKQHTEHGGSAKGGAGFKHPAEFLRPSSGDRQTDRRRSGGRGGGGGGRGGRGRRVPDFKKNPGSWTKYSLADTDEVTDRSNTAAALQFLKTIRNNSMETEDDPSASVQDEPSQKLLFKKPIKRKQDSATKRQPDRESGGADSETSAEPSAAGSSGGGGKFVGSKVVLQEYVVGAKPAKKTPASTGTAGKARMSANALKLSHLDDDEEAEDD